MTAILVAKSSTNIFSQGMETKKTVTPQEVVENVHKAAELPLKSPKVAVLFEVKPQTEGKEEYLKLAAALKAELIKMPRFIRVDRFGSPLPNFRNFLLTA